MFLGTGCINQDDALSADEALDYFSRRIKQNPGLPALWNNRGRVWEEKKEFDKAIADYNEAAKLAPNDAATHNNLGSAYHAQGKLAEAIEHFNAAIEAAPTNATLYYNRGRVNQDAGNYAAAAQDFTQAIKVDPNYLPAYNNAAWLAATCPDQKYRNGKLALEYAEKAAEMTQGKVWELLDTLAAAQAESGDYAAAVKTSEQALTLGSDAAIHAGVRDRMTLYQQGKPYRMPADSPASPQSTYARWYRRAAIPAQPARPHQVRSDSGSGTPPSSTITSMLVAAIGSAVVEPFANAISSKV